MSSGSRKRSREEMLFNAFETRPQPTITRMDVATTDTWSQLVDTAARSGHAVFRFGYQREDPGGDIMTGNVSTAHTHGDFNTGLSEIGTDQFALNSLNISTKRLGYKARAHDALFDITGSDKPGVTNIMRVLKGTDQSIKPLYGTKEQVRGAVEFAAEMGISEMSRGGKVGLLHGMESLYLLKHGTISRKQFLNPKYGFVGAGDGGAARLRKFDQNRKSALRWHKTDLKTRFAEVQKTKPKWSDKTFSEWRSHKIEKWSQKF